MRNLAIGAFGILLTATLTIGAEAAPSGADVKPIKQGEIAPEVSLKTADGKDIKLTDLFGQKGAVVIFYRGGWCPFCNKHLQSVQKISAKLNDAGYPVLAISPETLDHLKETANKDKLTYQLLSDPTGAAIRAFGLAYKVDDTLKAQLAKYNLDLTAWNAQPAPELPVPALLVLDKTGKVLFIHFDPDYTKRLSNDDILKAAGVQ